MNNQFWIDRWAENRIGFHNPGVHQFLRGLWDPALAADAGRVLVPLCGKSHDLAWLSSRGHEVIGVELSEIAVRAYGEEHDIRLATTRQPPFTRMRSDGIEFLVGDFFDLTPDYAGRFPLAYDRAALIALPRERRPEYVAKLKQLLEPGGTLLLITIEWDLEEDQGPPFGVTQAEVGRLFAPAGWERLDERDCLDEEPRFRDRGATWMREVAYRIRMPGA